MCIYMFQMYKKKVLIKTFNKTETFSIVLAYSSLFLLYLNSEARAIFSTQWAKFSTRLPIFWLLQFMLYLSVSYLNSVLILQTPKCILKTKHAPLMH